MALIARRTTLALVLACASCRASTLAPHGEAFFVVDTDLPVPALAGRLRVDLYTADGTWFESRDIGRADPLDWPATFSVYSDDDARDVRVLVRLRAYPEGVVRTYQGERFAPRPTFAEPHVASSVSDLCASAPELPIGGRLVGRRGGVRITDLVVGPSGSCTFPNAAGSTAARVTIAKAGTYGFDVADSFPYIADSSLFLRSRCDDPTSQLACESGARANHFSSGHFPRFHVALAPGTYWLMTGGAQAYWPADLTLEAFSVADPQAAGAESPSAPSAIPAPLRLRPASGSGAGGGAEVNDPTPTTEPEPNATVDRLVLVKLVPGVRGAARITLRGACVGTMAKLGHDPASPDAATATTCLDTENVSAPLGELALDPDRSVDAASARGAFGSTEPCAADASTEAAACIPGGSFLLGGPAANPLGSSLYAATPARIARMPRFYLDRDEVTVAQVRAAIAGGLAVDPDGIGVDDVTKPSTADPMVVAPCSYTAAPSGREALSASCVTWRFARAYCQMRGGDLPTEAQWEYAASAAGRPFKTLYAWGDDPPACDRAVYGRAGPADSAGTDCAALLHQAVGPVPASEGAGDVTALGVRSLMGGLLEWTLDSAAPYDSACWRAAGLTSPRCFEENAPFRTLRGSSWLEGQIVPATARSALPPNGVDGLHGAIPSHVGFRCAYAEPAR